MFVLFLMFQLNVLHSVQILHASNTTVHFQKEPQPTTLYSLLLYFQLSALPPARTRRLSSPKLLLSIQRPRPTRCKMSRNAVVSLTFFFTSSSLGAVQRAIDSQEDDDSSGRKLYSEMRRMIHCSMSGHPFNGTTCCKAINDGTRP